jgi:hypothetical protein
MKTLLGESGERQEQQMFQDQKEGDATSRSKTLKHGI